METTAAERVALMMSELSVDQPAFGLIAGASKSVVNQWLNGKILTIAAPYAYQIQRSKGYNAEWIQTGKGDIKIGYTDTPQVAQAPNPAPATLTTDQLIEMLAARLAAEDPEQAQDAIAILQGEVSKARRRGVEPPQFSNQREPEQSVPKKATSG